MPLSKAKNAERMRLSRARSEENLVALVKAARNFFDIMQSPGEVLSGSPGKVEIALETALEPYEEKP